VRAYDPIYREILTTAHSILVQVQSWRGGVLLADNVPVLDGTITYDDTANLRRRLTLDVPLYDPVTRTSWDPGDNPNHPLNWYGQRLQVNIGVGTPSGGSIWFNHGWYLIDSWELSESAEGQIISVSAVDLSQLIDDDRLYTVQTPLKGNTYRREFTTLLDGMLPVVFAPELPERTVNANTVWDRDRRKNLDDLCAAWGARWYVDDTGSARVEPAYTDVTSETVPDTVIQWGASGTIVERGRSGARGRLYNAVVVTGKQAEDSTEVQPFGWAEIRDINSPIRVLGPFGRRPRFYASDLLTTAAQCTATAKTMLADVSRVSRSEPVTAVPDYALEPGDVVQIRTSGTRFTGRVQSIELPLTATAGPMTLTVSTVPEDNDDEGGE
jgi:hypothetical protein